MQEQVIQDWTAPANNGDTLAGIEYRVVRIDNCCQQQVRKADGAILGSIQLPDGVRMDRLSFEVMLRYAMTQIAA
ncbi:MAG: hypothetical protein AAGH76_01645 [Pseudomonadota bacterium]